MVLNTLKEALKVEEAKSERDEAKITSLKGRIEALEQSEAELTESYMLEEVADIPVSGSDELTETATYNPPIPEEIGENVV